MKFKNKTIKNFNYKYDSNIKIKILFSIYFKLVKNSLFYTQEQE